MIVGLVSCYREGRLIIECVRSALAGCDRVIVLEAPIEGGTPDIGEPTMLDQVDGTLVSTRDGSLVSTRERPFASDAAKRTELLRRAQAIPRREGEPLWVLWLDGDELLLWPELLRDYVHRVDLEETATGGAAIRIVELDGSVAISYGKLIRGDHVRRYLESSYQVELLSGMIVALPNVPVCSAGGIPLRHPNLSPSLVMAPEQQDAWLARSRPPLAGEPHLLHRTALRHPDRAKGRRMHDAEAEWFPQALEEQGLEGVDRP